MLIKSVRRITQGAVGSHESSLTATRITQLYGDALLGFQFELLDTKLERSIAIFRLSPEQATELVRYLRTNGMCDTV